MKLTIIALCLVSTAASFAIGASLPRSEADVLPSTSQAKPEATPKANLQAKCSKIQQGMSTDEVVGVLGEPNTTNQSSYNGFQNETYSYGSLFHSEGYCGVTFTDGEAAIVLYQSPNR